MTSREFYFTRDPIRIRSLSAFERELGPWHCRNRRTRYIIGRRKTISTVDWFYCFGRLAIKRMNTLRCASRTKRLRLLSFHPAFDLTYFHGRYWHSWKRATDITLHRRLQILPIPGRKKREIAWYHRETCTAFRSCSLCAMFDFG